MTNCRHCHGEMVSRRENHAYKDCGLPNVMLADVLVSRCASCRVEMVSIPAIEDLHEFLVGMVLRSQSTFGPAEIRFLRKWLGWSTADFCEKMGVPAQVIQQWESEPHSMPSTAQAMLRQLVSSERPIQDYEHNDAINAVVSHGDYIPVIRVRRDSSGWRTNWDGARPSC